jgi:hypothetical protein
MNSLFVMGLIKLPVRPKMKYGISLLRFIRLDLLEKIQDLFCLSYHRQVVSPPSTDQVCSTSLGVYNRTLARVRGSMCHRRTL